MHLAGFVREKLFKGDAVGLVAARNDPFIADLRIGIHGKQIKISFSAERNDLALGADGFDDGIRAIRRGFGIERFDDEARCMRGPQIVRDDRHAVTVYRESTPFDFPRDERPRRIMREPFRFQIFHHRPFPGAQRSRDADDDHYAILYNMNSERLEKPFFAVLLLCAVILALFVFLPELNALVLGAAFAIFFHPLYKRICRGLKKHDGLAAFFTLLIAAIVIVVPLIFFCVALFSEAGGLYAHLTAGGIAPLESLIGQRLGSMAQSLHPSSATFALVNVDFNQYITQAVGVIVTNAGNILARIGEVAWTFFLAFFAFFYLMKDGDKLRKLIVRGVPLADERAEEVITKLVDMAMSVVRGSLLMAIAWGVVVGIELFVFGVPNPVLWGALSIPIAFIPVIGVSLVIVPSILYVALVAGIAKAVLFAAIAFAVSAIMENVLHPLVIGRGKHIHPLLLLFSVLGGLSFFGPIGLFLGPLVLSLLLTLFEIYPTLVAEK